MIDDHTKILDPEERKEIRTILDDLTKNEQVLVVATQKRWYPGGSPITPNTVFATDTRIIIRNPMLFGLREHVDYFDYKKITNIKAVKGYFTSALKITSPGMGTAARNLTGPGSEDGIISCLDPLKAAEIVRIAKDES